MEYNTIKKDLILPEYGRNIQMMAEHLVAIEDRDKRTEAAYELVEILITMNPTVKESKDYKIKIWNFLSELCQHKLDIDFPYPIVKKSELPPPGKLPYNTEHNRFRHYGVIVQRMIKVATEFEDSPEKDTYITMIANHMKKAYVAWNQKSVNDEIIITDLYKLSQGKLKLSEETKLMHVSSANAPQVTLHPTNKKKFVKKGNQPQNNNGKNNNHKNTNYKRK